MAAGIAPSVVLQALVKMKRHQPTDLAQQRFRRGLRELGGLVQGEEEGLLGVEEERLLGLVIWKGSGEPLMMWSRNWVVLPKRRREGREGPKVGESASQVGRDESAAALRKDKV